MGKIHLTWGIWCYLHADKNNRDFVDDIKKTWGDGSFSSGIQIILGKAITIPSHLYMKFRFTESDKNEDYVSVTWFV